MKREIIEPALDEHGDEIHPSWALIGASRVSSSPPGAVLFDSDVTHQHFVTVRIRRASRSRKLGHDYKYGKKEMIEVAMSEAQWASFVSSMNVGDGVPCTVLSTGDLPFDHLVPGEPYAPRLQESMDEVRSAGDRAIAEVKAAFARYREKKTAENLRSLEAAINNTTPNLTFAAKSLSEHAENVVQRARADVEAMVVTKARQLGLEPGDLGLENLQLGAGEEAR